MGRADWTIYVTDVGQEQHFFMIFDAAEQAGWHKAPITRLSHMGFGVIQGEEQKKAAERIGIAAMRYFDMKQNRTSDYVFNYDRMLDAKGNSALYLFYAYARIRAIERKAGDS